MDRMYMKKKIVPQQKYYNNNIKPYLIKDKKQELEPNN